MTGFVDFNPSAVFIYYMCVTVPAMFCMNPVLMAISFTGGLAWYIVFNNRQNLKRLLLFFAVPLLGAVVNPVFNHKGSTYLFFVNNSAVTLESVVYGAVSGLMIGAVLVWFASFSQIMTTDRLLYVFGGLSPKLALILSMTLRYIPLFRRQIAKTNSSQRALGLYDEDTVPDRIRGGMRIFSVMVTWALENGVITADSMTARGYGVGRRSRFAIFKWRRSDMVLTVISVVLFAGVVCGIGLKYIAFEFFPVFAPVPLSGQAVTVYVMYGILVAVPVIIQMKEDARWNYLKSTI